MVGSTSTLPGQAEHRDPTLPFEDDLKDPFISGSRWISTRNDGEGIQGKDKLRNLGILPK
jgi:hypothetical protein